MEKNMIIEKTDALKALSNNFLKRLITLFLLTLILNNVYATRFDYYVTNNGNECKISLDTEKK